MHDAANPVSPYNPAGWTRRTWLIVAVAGLVVFFGWQHYRGSPVAQVDPGKLAQTIGAAWCEDAQYELDNRVDGSKAELYTCVMPHGAYKCVTDENGVARDVTAAAKLSFAGTLGADRPDCVRF